MTLHIHVGGSFADLKAKVIDTVERIERGDTVQPEFHLSFPDWPTFFKTMTPHRVEILRYVHEHEPPSILALSKGIGRGYRRTHEDVQEMIAAGLLSKRSDGSLSTELDLDHADIVAA